MPVNFGVGFNITSREKIDQRLVLTKAEMVSERYALTGGTIALPDKYICLCVDDNRLYVYDSGNESLPDIGKFRLESGLNSTVVTIGGTDYSYITKDGLPVQVSSAVFDSAGHNIAEILSDVQPAITPSSKLSADLVDDRFTVNKFITEEERQAWNAKQDALPAGDNNTFLHKNAITGQLEWKFQEDIAVDDYLSPVSKNPVQNKVIYEALGNVQLNPNTYNCGQVPTVLQQQLFQDIQAKRAMIVNGILYQYQKYEIDVQNLGTEYATYQSLDWTFATGKLLFKFITVKVENNVPLIITQYNVSITNEE